MQWSLHYVNFTEQKILQQVFSCQTFRTSFFEEHFQTTFFEKKFCFSVFHVVIGLQRSNVDRITWSTEACSELCQTSKMNLYYKNNERLKDGNYFCRNSILDVRQRSEYITGVFMINNYFHFQVSLLCGECLQQCSILHNREMADIAKLKSKVKHLKEALKE